MTIESPSNTWSPEGITDDEQTRMLGELAEISAGNSLVEYGADNFLNFDDEDERGQMVANYVAGSIRPAIKNRREGKVTKKNDEPKQDAEQGAQLELFDSTSNSSGSRLNPREVKQKNKRQVLAVMGRVAKSSKSKLEEVSTVYVLLKELHDQVNIPPDEEKRTLAEMVLNNPSALESLGMFAWELDSTKEAKTKEAEDARGSFVDLLNLALDENDEGVLKSFIAAARTNTGIRGGKSMRQAEEFDIAMSVWRGQIAYADAYPPTQKDGYNTDDQIVYVTERRQHAGGPGRYDTE